MLHELNTHSVPFPPAQYVRRREKTKMNKFYLLCCAVTFVEYQIYMDLSSVDVSVKKNMTIKTRLTIGGWKENKKAQTHFFFIHVEKTNPYFIESDCEKLYASIEWKKNKNFIYCREHRYIDYNRIISFQFPSSKAIPKLNTWRKPSLFHCESNSKGVKI